MINGVDLVVLGRIDFGAVPFFAVAATASDHVRGVIGSIYNALLPVAARIYEFLATGARWRLFSTTVYASEQLSPSWSPSLILCNEPLLSLWVAVITGQRSSLVMSILVMAAFLVRTSVMMYVICSVASGTHGRSWPGPVLEAAANLSLSILLGIWIGSTRVALGTLVSAGIGVAAWLAFDRLRTVIDGRPGFRVLVSALARPTLLLLPIAVLGMLIPGGVRATWQSLIRDTADRLRRLAGCVDRKGSGHNRRLAEVPVHPPASR